MGGHQRTLRRPGVVAAIGAAYLLFAAASAGAAPLAWVLDPSEGSVTTFNPATNQIVGIPIQTGDGPSSIAISPNGKRAYVANSTGESVTVIETGARIPIATIALPGPGEQVAISPDGANAYVTTGGAEKVTVISTATNTVERSIALGAATSAVVAGLAEPFGGPPDEFIYVGVGPEEIQGVNPARPATVNSPIKVGGVAKAIAYAPDGDTAYVAAGNEVTVVGDGGGMVGIPIGTPVSALAVSPDGSRVYVTSTAGKSVTAISTATDKIVGTPIEVAGAPEEIAITASGRTAYVADASSELVTPINLVTGVPGTPLFLPGSGGKLAISPDQPPVAAFNAPEAAVGSPVTFSGAPSVDPDGSIATYQWSLGDGASSRGPTVTHTFANPGTYFTMLTVTDEEGCGVVPVFSGRTAYCNGSGVASVTHPVTVKAPATAPVCSAKFTIGGVTHNRKNGTVRLRVRFRSTGSFLLFGKKVHAVTRKVRKPGTTLLTLHARVELAKRLKKTLHASVRYRLTFTPNAGCGSKTVHRSVALLRAPRKKHQR
jgi:YVTN family beta-propeller protein